MAAKTGSPRFQMSAEHRTKIANSKILKHLIEHAEGTRDLSSSQVQAGLGLLRKVMPDLQYSENDTNLNHNYEISDKPLTEEEWSGEYTEH